MPMNSICCGNLSQADTPIRKKDHADCPERHQDPAQPGEALAGRQRYQQGVQEYELEDKANVWVAAGERQDQEK